MRLVKKRTWFQAASPTVVVLLRSSHVNRTIHLSQQSTLSSLVVSCCGDSSSLLQLLPEQMGNPAKER